MSFTAKGAVSGTLTLVASSNTADYTITLPGAVPSQGDVLRASDGLGNTEWSSAVAAGSDSQVQYNKNGELAGDANLAFDDATGTLSALNVNASRISLGTSVLEEGALTGLDNPVNNGDASNKAYVDAVAQGLKWKDVVRAATTGNITLSGEQEVDTVLLVQGRRCLVKNQNLAAENGIYVVSTSTWTRSEDLQGGAGASGAATLVEAGQLNGVSGWLCNNEAGNDIVGADELNFIRFTGAGALSAGNAISISTNVISVVPDGVTTEISANKVAIKDGGVAAAKLATNCVNSANIVNAAVTNAKLANPAVTVSPGDGLQGGGAVALGSAVALSVDGSVVRTSGNQNIGGVKTLTDATQSTSASTGCLVLAGGVGVAKNLFSQGRIETSGVVQGGSLSDSVATLSGGALSGATSIACASLSSTGAVAGGSITDGAATLSAGSFIGIVDIDASGSVTADSVSDGVATLSAGVLSGVAAPTEDSHATNKAYVDSLSTGLRWKDPVRVAAASNLPLSGLSMIDGVAVADQDRVLVRGQTSASENGVYVASAGAWARSGDFSSGSAERFAVLVTAGDTFGGASFTVTAESPFTIGVSSLVFTQFSGNPTVNAGAGLSKTGNTLNVVTDQVTTEILANSIQLKNGGVTASKLAANCVNSANIVNAAVTNEKLATPALTVSAGDGLQDGGAVALGSSVALSVDSSVVRTSGNQEIGGIKTLTDTTQSTSAATGALVIAGGVGVAKNLFSQGRIETSGVVQGASLSDSVATLSGGALSGATSIACASLSSSGAVAGGSITDGAATLSAGSFIGVVNIDASGSLTLSAFPPQRVLFTGAAGLVSSAPALVWDDTVLSATKLKSQEILREDGNSTGVLFSNGTGNVSIGPNSTGTVQLGFGPMLRMTTSSSTLKSDLTVQGNFSRKLTIGLVNDAANATYSAQQLFDGAIRRDCNGSARTDTLPSAVDIVAIVPECVVGSSFEFIIENTSSLLTGLTIEAGQGISLTPQIISKGLSKRFVALVTSTTFGAEAVSVFTSSPKDRIMIQASLSNPTSGGNAVTYASWGPTSTALVDSTALGVSGTITQLVCTYSSATPLGIDANETLSFSIGTADTGLSVFTPFTGGQNLIVWDNTFNGTFPSTSSGPVAIPFLSTERLAIQSVETGTVNPITSEIRCLLTIELN